MAHRKSKQLIIWDDDVDEIAFIRIKLNSPERFCEKPETDGPYFLNELFLSRKSDNFFFRNWIFMKRPIDIFV